MRFIMDWKPQSTSSHNNQEFIFYHDIKGYKECVIKEPSMLPDRVLFKLKSTFLVELV